MEQTERLKDTRNTGGVSVTSALPAIKKSRTRFSLNFKGIGPGTPQATRFIPQFYVSHYVKLCLYLLENISVSWWLKEQWRHRQFITTF